MAGSIVVYLLYTAVVLSGVVFGSRIVILPAPVLSHVMQGHGIANALAEAGHEVYMVFPDHFDLDRLKGGKIKFITHHTPNNDINNEDLDGFIMDLVGKTLTKVLTRNPPGLIENCQNILSDEKLHQTLKDLDPDLFLLDSFMFTQCMYIVPYRLNKPYVSYGTVQLPQWARVPALPSFVPLLFGVPYTEKMTFFERIDNLLSTIDVAIFPRPPLLGDNWVEKYAPEKPPVSLDYLIKQSSLWFVHSDPLLDYPRPTMPNEIFVGGLTTKPAKPLPSKLDEIARSAKDGLIVMSFGSGLPDLHTEKFLRVFAKLKQVIFWRHISEYKGDVPVPKNVHMSKWLPQTDLIGHKKTKLFITHAGSNGQFEALYHGVPMLALPGFGDQLYNAKRMAYHAFGKELNIMTFSEAELELTIREIIKDPSYTQNIQHASKIFHSRPDTPLERVVYWVNHVLKYGDNHLKSYAIKMPWYSYWMLDIFAFLLAVALSFILVLYCLIRKCFKRSSTKNKTE